MTDVKKYLPSHLIPNDLILKMDKQKYFPEKNDNVTGNVIGNISSSFNNENNLSQNNPVIEKYKDFFRILKDDVKKMMDKNISMSQDVNDIEEERQYYLDKISNVLEFARERLGEQESNPESDAILQSIIKIITHVPEDFK